MFSKIKKLGMEVSEATGLAHGGSQHRSQARCLMSSGDYVKALKQLNLSLEWVPDDDDSYFLRGQCHDHLHQDQEAIEDYSQAIRLSKQHSPKTAYHQKRGDCYMRLHRYSDALSDYNDAVRTGPDSPDNHTDYPLLKTLQEQAKQALEAAEAERQQRAQEQQERARLEQAQRQALEVARQKAAQEAERQPLAAQAAARLEATVKKYTRIGKWLPDDLAQVFEALNEDYVHEMIGQRSHLVIEDEQTIRSQVKQIRNEEQAKAMQAPRQAEVARLEAAEAARVELENRPWLAARVFGAEKWKKYFGDVGAEPSLPSNIREVLLAPCPIWPGKRVEETHKLVLIPERVNGVPLTLNHLEGLIKAPREGHPTKFSYYYEGVKKENGETYYTRSHWVLMTRDVIPGSRSKSYADQTALVARLGLGYEVPSVLRAAVCILMEHVETGVRLFSDAPWTYTRCLEQVGGCWHVVVGYFGRAGPLVSDCDSRNLDHESCGVAALRMF